MSVNISLKKNKGFPYVVFVYEDDTTKFLTPVKENNDLPYFKLHKELEMRHKYFGDDVSIDADGLEYNGPDQDCEKLLNHLIESGDWDVKQD